MNDKPAAVPRPSSGRLMGLITRSKSVSKADSKFFTASSGSSLKPARDDISQVGAFAFVPAAASTPPIHPWLPSAPVFLDLEAQGSKPGKEKKEKNTRPVRAATLSFIRDSSESSHHARSSPAQSVSQIHPATYVC
ncbi:MAG: hypothetical protein Q8P67_12445 [archaeon]|nr:hypothetical protein [archaeon]